MAGWRAPEPTACRFRPKNKNSRMVAGSWFMERRNRASEDLEQKHTRFAADLRPSAASPFWSGTPEIFPFPREFCFSCRPLLLIVASIQRQPFLFSAEPSALDYHFLHRPSRQRIRGGTAAALHRIAPAAWHSVDVRTFVSEAAGHGGSGKRDAR